MKERELHVQYDVTEMGKLFSALCNKKRRIFYMFLFAFAFFIDQRTKTCNGLDGWVEAFQDMTGIVMAFIIMSHYRLADFKKWKIPYLAWSGIWVIGLVPAFLWGRSKWLFLNDWCVLLIDIILFGYILIHTFISVVIEKKHPKINVKFTVVWAVMMLLMIFSRSDYLWPFTYFVMFGCFYLTDYSKEEEEDLFQGLLDGAILAFFLMQGWCFVFRPYDVVRYIGVYSNPNINAVFYLEVLAAVFTKLIYVNRIKANKWIKIFYWLGSGVVFSFLFLTIGRTGWLTAFGLGLVFLGCLNLVQERKKFFVNGLLLVLCACITFPVVFGAVRYLPPVFHHPVWHFGEWNESKVHSWDPWDSEKYVELDEFLDAALGRITDAVEGFLENSPLAITAEAGAWKNGENPTPIFDNTQVNGVTKRKTIYQQYFEKLNLFGHPYDEQGFQMYAGYWVGHAHNIYLQYGTDFGLITMVLFIGLILWSLINFVRQILKTCKEQEAGYLLFLLVPAIFGLLEYSWGVGSITILLLFVAWRKVVCNEK